MSSQSPDFRQRLISAAYDRGIVLTKKDLDLITKSGPNSQLAKWAERILPPQFLLSLDADDNDYHAAIKALEDSTKALEQQTQTLEIQNVAFKEKYQEEIQSSAAVAKCGNQIKLRERSEIETLQFEIHDRLRQLRGYLDAGQVRISKTSKALPTVVNEVLHSHDRILAHLTQHGLSTSKAASTQSADFERVKKLADALQKSVVEALHDRLDRIYLESLEETHNTLWNGESSSADLVHPLKEDLKSLYSDIRDVALMSTSQQYTIPISNALSEFELRSRAVANLEAQVVESQLIALTSSLEKMTADIRYYQSYRIAREAVGGHAGALDAAKESVQDQSPVKPMPTPTTSSLLMHLGVPIDEHESYLDTKHRLQAKVERSRQIAGRSKRSIEQTMKTALIIGRDTLEPLRASTNIQAGSDVSTGMQALDEKLQDLKTKVEGLNLAESDQQAAATQQFLKAWQ